MKSPVFLLLFTAFGCIASAQQQDVQVYEKKEGTKVLVMARNVGKVPYLVSVMIDAKGMDVSPSMKTEAVVPAGHIKEMATLQPRPGEAWSYGYEVSFMEYTGGALPPEPVIESNPTPTESKAQATTAAPSPSTATPLSNARIIVYTKPGCSRCEFVKKQMNELKIPYELVDVASASPEVNDMWMKLRQGGFTGDSVTMPVVRVDGKYHYDIKDLNKFISGLK